MIRIFNIETYLQYVLSQQKLNLEIRQITDKLFVEKIAFMEINNNSEDEKFIEVINYPNFEILKILPVILKGPTLEIEPRNFLYNVSQYCVIYATYIDRNNFAIRTSDSSITTLNPDDIFRLK
jgi:hypothetical protein